MSKKRRRLSYQISKEKKKVDKAILKALDIIEKSFFTMLTPNFVKIKKSDFMTQLVDLTDVIGLQFRFIESSTNSNIQTFEVQRVKNNDVLPAIEIDTSLITTYIDLDNIHPSLDVREVFWNAAYDKFGVDEPVSPRKEFIYFDLTTLDSIVGDTYYFSQSFIGYGNSIDVDNSNTNYYTIKVQGKNEGTSWLMPISGSVPDSIFVLGLPCPPEWKTYGGGIAS